MPDPPMEMKALARDMLSLLDMQQSYFKSRLPAPLEASKAAERAMRKRCNAIRAPTPPPGLFDRSNTL